MSDKTTSYKSPFGLEKEMGYTRQEFLELLSRLLAEYPYSIHDDEVAINLEKGRAIIKVDTERERRLSDLVRFPILPVRIRFVDADPTESARFLREFDRTYMKGLG